MALAVSYSWIWVWSERLVWWPPRWCAALQSHSTTSSWSVHSHGLSLNWFLVKNFQLCLIDGVTFISWGSWSKQKMVVPSDNRKKNLANCRVALQYLKEAGVPLKDDEAMMITGEDVADGDRELTISLLWNIFVHLQVSFSCFPTPFVWQIAAHVFRFSLFMLLGLWQLPLLINGRLLTEEIYKVQGLEQVRLRLTWFTCSDSW